MDLDHKAILYFPDRWSMNFDQSIVSYFKDKHNTCTNIFDDFYAPWSKALDEYNNKWVDYKIVVGVGSGADYVNHMPPGVPTILIDPINEVLDSVNSFIIRTPFINDAAIRCDYKNCLDIQFDEESFKRHVIMDVVESYGFWFENALDKAIEFFDKQNGSKK